MCSCGVTYGGRAAAEAQLRQGVVQPSTPPPVTPTVTSAPQVAAPVNQTPTGRGGYRLPIQTV